MMVSRSRDGAAFCWISGQDIGLVIILEGAIAFLMETILATYTKAIAGHLEAELKSVQILSWSDLLSNVGRAKQRSRLAFGISGRAYTPMANGCDGTLSDLLTCTFEMQCDLFGPNGKPGLHDELMDATYRVERHILYGYQPFAEFSPLRPVRGGNIRLDQVEGRYTYSSEFTSSVVVTAGGADKVTAIAAIKEPEIIGVALINQWDPSSPNAVDARLVYNLGQ
jgi:hypothetical protein